MISSEEIQMLSNLLCKDDDANTKSFFLQVNNDLAESFSSKVNLRDPWKFFPLF